MNTEEYKEILSRTITKSYPEYMWCDLFKHIESLGVVRYDGRKTLKEGMVDLVPFQSNRSKLIYIFNELNNIVELCEEFEYERGYRYSSIYKYSKIDIDRIEMLIESKRVNLFDEENMFSDELNTNFRKPTIKREDEKVYIKFSLRVTSKLEGAVDLKYVVVAVINIKNKTIEIRQDIIPLEYKHREKFYEENVGQVKAWLKSYLLAEFEELDLQAVTKFMKSNRKQDVKVTALKLRRDGMTAELDAASNADLMLPILDELRNKITREDIFNDNDTGRDIKKILEDFMSDIEENSDLPAAKILWIERDFKVNMYHGEVDGGIAFLKWIGELKNKECMEYVTQYIVDSEKALREQLEN